MDSCHGTLKERNFEDVSEYQGGVTPIDSIVTAAAALSQ